MANFTIGQRRGLRIAEGTPIYVTRLDAETDTVFVGPREAVLSETTRVTRVSWLREPPVEAIRAEVQIRYHHEPAPARLMPETDGAVRLRFDAPQSAITPGQAAVFYAGDEVLGGGWIEAL